MKNHGASVPEQSTGDSMAAERKDVVVALRLPKDFLKRADRLMEPLSKTDLGVTEQLSRAKVLRLAVKYGLEALEAEHGGK